MKNTKSVTPSAVSIEKEKGGGRKKKSKNRALIRDANKAGHSPLLAAVTRIATRKIRDGRSMPSTAFNRIATPSASPLMPRPAK